MKYLLLVVYFCLRTFFCVLEYFNKARMLMKWEWEWIWETLGMTQVSFRGQWNVTVNLLIMCSHKWCVDTIWSNVICVIVCRKGIKLHTFSLIIMVLKCHHVRMGRKKNGYKFWSDTLGGRALGSPRCRWTYNGSSGNSVGRCEPDASGLE
jgi:hypothetical protein